MLSEGTGAWEIRGRKFFRATQDISGEIFHYERRCVKPTELEYKMKPISEENLSDAIIWQACSKLGASIDKVSELAVETINCDEEAY